MEQPNGGEPLTGSTPFTSGCCSRRLFCHQHPWTTPAVLLGWFLDWAISGIGHNHRNREYLQLRVPEKLARAQGRVFLMCLTRRCQALLRSLQARRSRNVGKVVPPTTRCSCLISSLFLALKACFLASLLPCRLIDFLVIILDELDSSPTLCPLHLV